MRAGRSRTIGCKDRNLRRGELWRLYEGRFRKILFYINKRSPLLWLGIWFVSGITSTVLQNIDSQQRRYAYFHQIGAPPPVYDRSDPSRPQKMREWRQAREKARTRYRLAELEFSKNDWRPLVSYAGNLSRIGQQLLKTNQTWQTISNLQPDPASRDTLLATYMGPQYPWFWSAAVLAGLAGLSVCILNLSIKSLDRLK